MQFVEAARNFAQRLITKGGKKPADQIRLGFEMATARPPSATEAIVLLNLHAQALAKYKADAEATKKLLSFGESKRDEKIDAAEHAAMTIIASTILNLDEALTRQ